MQRSPAASRLRLPSLLILPLAFMLLAAPAPARAAAGETKPADPEKKDRSDDSQRGFGRAIGDASITAAVKSALAGAKDVKAHNINVDTYKGVVTLKGVVQNREERKKAVKVASSVAGVRRVVDRLVIQP